MGSFSNLAWRCTVLSSAVLGLAACGRQSPPPQVPKRSSGTTQSASDHLAQALRFVSRLDEFERQQAFLTATYELNRWAETEPPPPADWTPDPLVERLPGAMRLGLAERLGAQQFQLSDAEMLAESTWMRDLSNWVASRPAVGRLAEDFQSEAASLGPGPGELLTIAYRLFDWTIRNIQLDAMLEYPADPVTVGTEGAVATRLPPPLRGVPGPGYQFTPAQVLLYGRGDLLNRAEVFILLARQQNIPVVMLAFPGLTSLPRPRPWVAAALIGQQLYLFDTRLGLPIPGPEGRAIATLGDVQRDPQLLATLNIGDELPYGVEPRELRTVWALIDASPPALSLRMQRVQDRLVGDDRLVLTVAPSELEKSLLAIGGVAEVRLWELPYETAWYAQGLAERLSNDQRAVFEHLLAYGIFAARNPLVRGRYHHFRGEFETQGEKKGAKMLYLESRVSNKQIEQLDSSPDIQLDLGVLKDQEERDSTWQSRLFITKQMMTQTKANASYWLGLAHFETGRYEAAIDWFQTRTLEAQPTGPWAPGARYNLARTYEALGRLGEARDQYLQDTSPQQHGNLIRARLLRPHLETPSG
jgi:tetratricopeptide (TPR) repeat protein